jgi:hypothetical protein
LGRDLKYFRGFFNAKATEEPQLDDLRPPRIDLRQAFEGTRRSPRRDAGAPMTMGADARAADGDPLPFVCLPLVV